MIPCISLVSTLGSSLEVDLEACSRAGWGAVELWLTKLEAALTNGRTVAEIAKLCGDLGLSIPGASAQGGLLTSQGAARDAHRDHFLRRLEMLQALGAGTLVITPDFHAEPTSDDLRRAVDALAEAGETARPFGVRPALEFQRSARFCASMDTAFALVAQAGSSNLGVCLDLFHYYCGPSKFEDLAYATRENLAWVQICDLSGTPREVATDADRIFPGEGDFALGSILDHLDSIGYDGGVSLEVLNPLLWSMPADRVVDAALQAMRRTLGERPSRAGGA